MPEVELLSRWIMKRYLILWTHFKENDFTFDEAAALLGKLQKPDSRKLVALFLSELRKSGWVNADFDPDDARRRIYRLKPYEDIFKEIVKGQGGKE